jgi:hypothetical protein
MDLVATVTAKDSVDVWRLNGQRVLGAGFAREEGEGEGEGVVEGEDGDVEGAKGGVERGFVRGVAWRRDGESRGGFSLLACFV